MRDRDRASRAPSIVQWSALTMASARPILDALYTLIIEDTHLLILVLSALTELSSL